jgi:hypothetical protein
MHYGGGVAVRKYLVIHQAQVSMADLISVAGHNLWPNQTPIEGRWSLTLSVENSGLRGGYALETLLCPHAGLLNASGLCPQTLLVSFRLGGGAATRHLVTDHQESERERQSNQRLRLGPFVQRVLHSPSCI